MGQSNKKNRRITVAGIEYLWRASGDSGYISVSVWPASLPHRGLWGTLRYDETRTPFELPSGTKGYSSSQQLVVTPKIIRRIIEYAVERHDFDPAVKAPQLKLFDLDPHIDTSDVERAS